MYNEMRHVVVRLDTWEAHAPNAAWQGEFNLLGEAQEGIEPLEFYRTGNQRMGHRIDLNGRLNGNLKTRRAEPAFGGVRAWDFS